MIFYDIEDKPYYDNQYPVFARQSGAVNTNVTIQHPNIFYFVLDASWSLTDNLEYWNKGNTATTINNNHVYKTIYSPSFTYFAEPKTAVFTGFTSNGGNQTSGFNVSGGFNKGWNFYCQPNFTGSTIFFSALGYRDVYSGRINTYTCGSIGGVGSGGEYWSAGPSSSTSYARYLDFHSDIIYPQGLVSRAYGFSVRPISE